jgi:hypothetical protein
MFFFPKKKIVVDCLTSNALASELYCPDKAVNFYPDWWKTLDGSFKNPKNGFTDVATMKTCMGFTDYYQNAFILPLWSDLKIKVDNENNFRWQFSDQKSSAITHELEQRKGFIENYNHLKLDSPWLFKSKSDVYFSVTQPIWNFTDSPQVIIPPALLEFKYQNITNINMFFPKTEKEYLFEAGHPMMAFTPCTENQVEFKTHLVDYQEFVKHYDLQNQVYFVNKYRKIKSKYTSLNKCPFNFLPKE